MQIEDLAKVLRSKGIKFDVVFSSPTERALQSARILAENLGCELKLDFNLRDTHIPKLEGQPLSIVKDQGFKNEYSEQFQGDGSETFDEFYTRSVDFLEYIRKGRSGQKVGIVSHGDVIRSMFWYFQHRQKPDPGTWRDKDYPEPAEAIELRFGANGEFLGSKHIRREKESLRESDPNGSRLKEV